MNISNSLLVEYRKYRNMETCGKQMQAIYIDKTHKFDTSEAAQAGQWFEWQATGQLPFNKKEPEPILTKSGKEAAIMGHLKGQLENFKRIYKDIEIIEKGYTVEQKIDGVNYKMVLDVLARMGGNEVIRDLKASGLINNKWEENGWEELKGGRTSSIPRKKHLYHAEFYIWLWWQVTGQVVDFYFDVFANTNPNDCKTIKIKAPGQEWLDSYTHEIRELVEMLHEDLILGLKVYPEMKRCEGCPLKEECEHRVFTPTVEEYTLGAERDDEFDDIKF